MTADATDGTVTADGALTTFPASLSDCQSCTWDMVIGGGPWDSQIATHTAETILLIIDNSTNITSTSTISASSFPSASDNGMTQFVSGTVATEDVSGVKVFLYD